MKKTTITVVGIVMLLGLVVWVNPALPVEVDNNVVATTTEIVVDAIEEQDVLDKAKEELDRINTELDYEENKLTSEIEDLENQIKTRQSRIDEVRNIRTSFQSAPGPSE